MSTTGDMGGTYLSETKIRAQPPPMSYLFAVDVVAQERAASMSAWALFTMSSVPLPWPWYQEDLRGGER